MDTGSGEKQGEDVALFAKRIKIERDLHDRLQTAAETEGYASVDDFILHALEKSVTSVAATRDEAMANRMRGLGYLE